MPDTYKLACLDCYEYLETYKWSVPLFSFDFDDHLVTTTEIEASVRLADDHWVKNRPDHWFSSTKPQIRKFATEHKGHKIRCYPETDYPWYPEQAGYFRWKQALPDLKSDELFLPRNLIDNLNIKSWHQVINHLSKNTVIFIEDIDLVEYKQHFELLVNEVRVS